MTGCREMKCSGMAERLHSLFHSISKWVLLVILLDIALCKKGQCSVTSFSWCQYQLQISVTLLTFNLIEKVELILLFLPVYETFWWNDAIEASHGI